MDSAAWVQFWIMVGGILTTAIAWYFRDHIAQLKSRPKGRIEIIFDGYEQLLSKQQDEIKRKNHVIQKLETLVEGLHTRLEEADNIVIDLREDLKRERQECRDLRRALAEIKTQYNNGQLTDGSA